MRQNKNIHYFFDMDGVIARWAKASIEETYKKGFFRSRTPEQVVIDAIKKMLRLGYRVSILSAAYVDDHSVSDKIAWLKANGLGDIDMIFVPYGEDKHKYLKDTTASLYVLIDDFSPVLFSWEGVGNRFLGIKFMNGINGTHGTWNGYTISAKMSKDKIVTAITSIAEAEAEEAANG